MVAIPKQNPVYEIMETGLIYQNFRPYLGLSGIGSPCHRNIWMNFRWVHRTSIEPRVHRIFKRGDLEEERVISDLKQAGMIVDSEQLQICDETGHIHGHIDGIVTCVPGAEKTKHLLEIKTMNDKRFKEYIKNGLKQTNYEYYVQVNMYMGYLELNRCLYCVTNKNDESRSFERYEFDDDCFIVHKAKAFKILITEEIPNKIGQRTWIDCRFCSHKEYCHGTDKTEVNCRTCSNVNLEMQGKWSCSLTGIELSIDEQLKGCSKYRKLECLN
jgi:ribosomal protein S27E